MADRYRHLKKVIECIDRREYYEQNFSDSDVETAKRELSAICQAVPAISSDMQRDLIKFLDLVGSRKIQEISKYKQQYDYLSRYNAVITEYEKHTKPNLSASDVHGSHKATPTRPNDEYDGSSKSVPLKTSESNEMTIKNMEISELKTRLSKVAGEKLRDNNPSIADLSDMNRPTKLAEHFKELYDNEWTSAYEALQSKSGMKSEEEIIKKLGKMLKMAYTFCRNQGRTHRNKIQETLVHPAGIHVTLNANVEPNVEKLLRPRVRQIQRETGVYAIPAIQEIFRNQHEDEIKKNEWNDSKEIMTYLENCVRICWLFAIQDPPMELLWPKEQSKVDDHLTEFTKRGNVISFVVWPSLYLHANGPLMCKGVVQPV
ncbi:uncharacterized protein LOC125678324 [Ostrea edulis]|uniref:uncharacterized protein LOC125678324 n=1 Tax=Ostrea edulis TaxID=37623 RepID=UPI0024AF01D1|nr:uncharacterized protein LOC125678324 [Ostrea edulis]